MVTILSSFGKNNERKEEEVWIVFREFEFRVSE